MQLLSRNMYTNLSYYVEGSYMRSADTKIHPIFYFFLANIHSNF